MKRLTLNLFFGLLAFACGLSVDALWNRSNAVKNEQRNVSEQSTTKPTPAPDPEPTPTPQVVFGRGRLRIVTEEVHLRSERLRYEIDVTYPQIMGAEDRHILKLNRRIKELATEEYMRPLSVTIKDLEPLNKYHWDVFNDEQLDFQVLLATDSLLSIYFNGYSYGIGAAHGSEYSRVINYDLASGKELKLARLFKPGSNYLEFISRYCSNELSLDPDRALEFTKDPASWNITTEGLKFTFDHCEFFACSEGTKQVVIPFTALKGILNTELNSLKQLGV